MTIGTRLLALLAIPLVALIALGIFTGVQLANIEARSRFVAESRIVALATLGNLSRAFTEMRVNLRSYLLASTEPQRTTARARFDEDEREVGRLLREYADHLVLGDVERRLLAEFQTLSGQWIDHAKQVIALEAAGRQPEALALFESRVSDLGLRLSEVSNEWIAHDQQAARVAGDASIAAVERFERRLIIAAVAAFLLTGALGVVTVRRIVNPIRALDASVNAIARGDYAKVVPFATAKDETGGLARSIDVLKQGAALMDEQRWVKSHVSRITGELQGAASLADFGQQLLSNLVPILGGGVASFYVFDDGPGRLERVAAYGLTNAEACPRSIALGEGLVGQAAQERKVVALTNLPPSYARVASSVGEASPVQATAMPAMSHDTLLGVLEVASFRLFDTREQTLLDELLPVTAMSLDILRRNLRTQELLDHTQEQARELEKQTEALRLSQEQLQRTHFQADTALELTQAGYWHVPLDGSGWYNSSERAARIFGDIPNPECRYRLDEWAEHVREGDEEVWKATMDNFSAAVEGRIPQYSAVYAYKRPVDGRIVWIRALGNVVKDAAGTPTDMFGVTQDITEFKRLERELVTARQKAEEATEMKSMFLANMSHEIRTPMNAIIGLSHLALKTSLSAKQRDYVSKIHNAGTSLLAVINDILDFSKIEAGRLDLETVEFNVDDVIGSVTTLTAQRAHEKGLEFLAHVSGGVPERLLGDPLRLGQILTNLVSNAVKFTERGDVRVYVEPLERTGDKVQLKFCVRDTGMGMNPEQAARLFQPFTQADMSTTRKHGGTGLGLTICRRLVELMGGRIWLESEPGVGTTFFFTVWCGVGDEAGARRVVPARLAHLRALVVDDNATAREILHESLSTIAERVDVAESGKEAIAAVRSHDGTAPYDIVFLDWRMPGMDGLQVSRHIKSDETLHHQPAIVLVTAFGREEVRAEAEQLQLDGFLVKPVTKSMLVDTLTNVFATDGDLSESRGGGDHLQRLRGARILLTEDNAINQQVATEILEAAGATVTIANNGQEAVDLLGGQSFDVVLMDLQMPRMDGFQATARIRSDSRFVALPVIAMTAHATTDERQRCLDAGMNDHIAKPIDPEHLIETVSRFYRAADASAGAPPVGAGTAQPADVDDLSTVDGLDAQAGLSRVGGNRRLYVKLLGEFAEQLGSAIDEVRQALGRDDRPLAERVAHSLKGVAANLGATRVASDAARLEKLIRDRAAAKDVEAAQDNAAGTLDSLVAQLRSALKGVQPEPPPAPPVATPGSPVPPLEAAARLSTLLSEFDPGAAEFVQANQMALRSLIGDARWAQFEKLVLSYAFEDAQTQLAEAMKSVSAG